jgi:hypothetical protein
VLASFEHSKKVPALPRSFHFDWGSERTTTEMGRELPLVVVDNRFLRKIRGCGSTIHHASELFFIITIWFSIQLYSIIDGGEVTLQTRELEAGTMQNCI